MTTRSTPSGDAYFVCCAGQTQRDGEAARPTQPTQPGTEENPKGEPAKPTDKPLPDLPNPGEVGEDG